MDSGCNDAKNPSVWPVGMMHRDEFSACGLRVMVRRNHRCNSAVLVLSVYEKLKSAGADFIPTAPHSESYDARVTLIFRNLTSGISEKLPRARRSCLSLPESSSNRPSTRSAARLRRVAMSSLVETRAPRFDWRLYSRGEIKKAGHFRVVYCVVDD